MTQGAHPHPHTGNALRSQAKATPEQVEEWELACEQVGSLQALVCDQLSRVDPLAGRRRLRARQRKDGK